MAATRLTDLIVPSIFTPYIQELSAEKSAIIQSGAAVIDPMATDLLSGGGITFNIPSFRDLAQTVENVSSEDPAVNSTPDNIGSAKEIAVRLSRNASWSDMDLNQALIGADPGEAIARLVSSYWVKRLQKAFIATMVGVFADNAAAPSGTDTHVQNDMTVDIKGGGYTAGVTDFSAESFIDATVTMGDSMEDLTLVLMHSIVYARALKNNLIDFIPDSEGKPTIPTFLGRRVVKDDGMPFASGVYETWLFGAGAVRMGQGSPAVPTETIRVPGAGNGAGQETLHSRVEWLLHPTGHAYIGTAPNGGPSNLTSANNLGAAASWSRVWPERKQVKIARLITRES